MRIARMTLFLSFLTVTLPGSARAQQTRPIELLQSLCATHSGEPACAKLNVFSEDDAWLILRTACRRDSGKACQKFRQQQGGALIYDAAKGTWRAEWETRSWPLKFDVAGTPTLRLLPRSSKSLEIAVEQVSPMAYAIKPGTPKEEDLPVIADLKTFLSAAATPIQAVIAMAAYSRSDVSGAPPPTSLSSPDRGRSHLDEKEALQPGVRPNACETPQVALLAATVQERNTQLANLNKKLRDALKQVDALDAARRAFIGEMQTAEDGGSVKAGDLKAADRASLASALAQLQPVADALATGADELADCQPLFAAYAALLSAPADQELVHLYAGKVKEVAETCQVERVKRALTTEADCAASTQNPSVQDWLKLHVASMKPLADRLSDVRGVEEKIRTAVNKTLALQPQVLSACDMLAREVDRALLHTWDGTLIQELVLTRPNTELEWNKVQTQTLIITTTSPYAKDLTLRHTADESHQFRIESAAGQILGYGIGVIYTPLHESTWTAISQDGHKVIGETKRETRAGDLAAFVNYRVVQNWPRPGPLWIEPTVDIGVGLTSGRPAFFLGAGLQIVRAIRLGAGWSPQRISMLGAGQTVGVTSVSSNDDIRTVNRFEMKNWYMSFSFGLDSLSLFNKP